MNTHKAARHSSLRKTSRTAHVQDLLQRAALLRWLAAAFAMPTPGQVAALRAELAKLPAAWFRHRHLRIPLRRVQRAMRQCDDQHFANEYLRLFANSGAVRLHETGYGDARRFAGREVELADLNGFYHAFGFRITDTDPDRPDHVSAELEFLSLLCVKEAYAVQTGWRSAARLTADAAEKFLEYHLGRWLGAFAAAVSQADAVSPWPEWAALIKACIHEECRLRRVRPLPFTGDTPWDGMQDDCLICPQSVEANETAVP